MRGNWFKMMGVGAIIRKVNAVKRKKPGWGWYLIVLKDAGRMGGER